MNFNRLIIGVLVALSAVLIGVSSKILVKRETDGQLDNQNNGYLGAVEKRPFCNAFTGCGKKRSNGYQTMDNREASDPLVRLSQRILTEAKQWELMQNKYKNNENPIYDYMSSRKRRSISSKK